MPSYVYTIYSLNASRTCELVVDCLPALPPSVLIPALRKWVEGMIEYKSCIASTYTFEQL